MTRPLVSVIVSARAVATSSASATSAGPAALLMLGTSGQDVGGRGDLRCGPTPPEVLGQRAGRHGRAGSIGVEAPAHAEAVATLVVDGQDEQLGAADLGHRLLHRIGRAGPQVLDRGSPGRGPAEMGGEAP